MRDWTPFVGFGERFTVAASSTTYVVLYPLPDFDVGDAEFLIEDEEESHLFLERIIGTVQLSWAQTASHNVAWTLLPMGVDYEALAVLEPFTTDWTPASSEWANVKFWDRRQYYLEATVDYPSTVDHPYWTQVDCHPRFGLGSKKNLWPVLAVHNYHLTVDIDAFHYLRGFWK